MHLTAHFETVHGTFSKHVHRFCKTKTLLVVKLVTIFLVAACLQVSASGFGQNISVSGKDLTLKKVFNEIQRQTGYSFLYFDKDLQNAKKITIDAQNEDLKDVLNRIFSGQPLTYTIIQNTIVVKVKPVNPQTSESITVETQNIDVRGSIVNENNEPVAGASVRVKGTTAGAVSDAQGKFVLRGVEEKATLVISATNIETFEVKLSGQTDIGVVKVKTKVGVLATVEVGYGAVRRKDLTGSVASIDVGEIKNIPFTSVDQALSGKAPGVQVIQADGSPGGVARIRIRGGSSLIGGNDPLYIIDGVQVTIQNQYIQSAADVINPVEQLGNDGGYANTAVGSSFARGLNTLAGLNINDIESIDILKDASATAIYGSRAANGVVIITTKKGKKNEKPILEANYYTGISNAITEKLLSADQYRAVMLEGAKNLNTFLASQNRPANAIATNIINNPSFLGSANTNWMDIVTRTGVTNNADLSIRGGGTGSRYYTSLSYTKQTGTLLGTDFSRLAGKINLDNEITNRLRLITNLDYGFTKNNITNGIYSSALYAPPTLNPYNANGSPANFDQVTFGIGTSSGIQNPLSLLKGINRSKNLLLLGSLALEYDILKSLKFRSTASLNYTNYHQLNYVPATVDVYSASGQVGVSSQGGIGTQGQSQQVGAFYENTLTWDKQFDQNNRLNLLVGTSWQKTNMQSFSASGQGFPDDYFLNGLSSAALALPPKASEFQSSLLSFYLRANYAFKEKYLLTFTGRSDESSKFPKSNRIGYFPSFGLAWRASDEKFLQNVSWLNELKLRVSAGYTGTQNLGDNLFYTLYTPGAYGGTNALMPTQLGNDRIKWETTLQKDAGIDFAMFNSRFRGALGYYSKKSSGLLMAYPVATSSGFASALVNIADISNKGFEIDLRMDAIRNKDTKWNIAFNISGNRSKVTRINKDIQNPSQLGYSDPFYNSVLSIGNTVLREGQPIGLIYGYKFTGVIKTQKELDDYRAASIYAQYGI